jgi:spermidine/putrescine transport system substrate-binding protein
MKIKMQNVFLVIAIATLIVFAVGCTKEETAKKQSNTKTLYLYNWTYYTPESVIDKFEEEFGAKVVLDYFGSNEDMFAKLQAGGSGYDIVFPSQDYASIMINLGMVIPLDLSKIPNSKYISPLALEKATYDPTMKYSIPYFMGASGIAVNTSKVTDYPHDWSIFADKKLKNRMSMLDDMREVMGDALAYLGYSVNSIDPAELKEAQDLINNEWKPNLTKFDAEGFAKSFSSGEFWVVHGYAEAIFEELEEDKWDNVDFFLPQEGGPMYLDSMVIPKGAKHVDLAHEFINFIHRPEIYAEFLDRFRFPSSIHTEAMNYTTKEPFYSESDLVNYELKNDLGKNLSLYDDIWQTIRYTE